MELYQLRQFQAAARHKNMTRAASELCIAQPALSKTIHKLEEEFGAQLFIRNKKGLECTRQGEILLEYADRILVMDGGKIISDDKPNEIFNQTNLLNNLNIGVCNSKEIANLLNKNGFNIQSDILKYDDLLSSIISNIGVIND